MKKLTEYYQVTKDQTALSMGSGDLEVLATPALVAMMENCAKRLLAPELSSNYTSVGFTMNLKHIAPTAIGTDVKVEAESERINTNKVPFSIKAFVDEQLVGEATHQRVIVETAAFLKKVK